MPYVPKGTKGYTTTNTCLPFHIVTFDIKAVVVSWHQFVYSLFIPCGRLVIQPGHNSILQVFIIWEACTSKVLLQVWKHEKSDGARSGLYGGCSKISQWNCSHNKACVCRAVCGRALSCIRTIPRESLSKIFHLQKTNNISQLTGFSIGTAMARAFSAEGHTESKERLHIQSTHLFCCSQSLVSGVQCDVEKLPHAVICRTLLRGKCSSLLNWASSIGTLKFLE